MSWPTPFRRVFSRSHQANNKRCGLLLIWRRGRDSNPCGAVSPHPISSRRRYDRFGTSPFRCHPEEHAKRFATKDLLFCEIKVCPSLNVLQLLDNLQSHCLNLYENDLYPNTLAFQHPKYDSHQV